MYCEQVAGLSNRGGHFIGMHTTVMLQPLPHTEREGNQKRESGHRGRRGKKKIRQTHFFIIFFRMESGGSRGLGGDAVHHNLHTFMHAKKKN